MRNTHSYSSAIAHAVDLSPSLDHPTEFIRWAEDISELISFIYYVGYDTVTQDLYQAAREAAGLESEY